MNERAEKLGEQIATSDRRNTAKLVRLKEKFESCNARNEKQYRGITEQIRMMENSKKLDHEK